MMVFSDSVQPCQSQCHEYSTDTLQYTPCVFLPRMLMQEPGGEPAPAGVLTTKLFHKGGLILTEWNKVQGASLLLRTAAEAFGTSLAQFAQCNR